MNTVKKAGQTLCVVLALVLCARTIPLPVMAAAEVQEGRGDLIADANGTFTLTLYADFSGGSPRKDVIRTKDIVLPLENEPASPSLIAFALAHGLSGWTGLDFKLNEVTFGEDSVTIDWSPASTLIVGLDGRAQKADFRFSDAVSLNWFMMDSLAQTLKNNLQVSTVYYSSNNGPVKFPNPEDMAAQGLSKLPVDQPYEGSAFFIAHANTRDSAAQAEEATANWWGEYKNNEAFCSVGITNYNGTSFNFKIFFLRDGHLLYEGVAAITSADKLKAEYGEFSFLLSNDFATVSIFVPENSDWSHLSGRYERIE